MEMTNDLIYFPTISYSEICNINNLETYEYKPIDILIYGSLSSSFPYRMNIVEELKNLAIVKGYNIIVCNKTLYGEAKDDIFAKWN